MNKTVDDDDNDNDDDKLANELQHQEMLTF